MSGYPLAVRLMIAQAALFSIELSLVHYCGPALSIVVFGAIRGFGGILIAIVFARKIDLFSTQQLPLHIVRGAVVLVYGWVLVLSFGRLPLADATAIAYLQIPYAALLAIPILGEKVSPRQWIAILIGVGGALVIAKPSFTGVGLIYGIAVFGTALNALSFVLNRYANRRDSPTTIMAYSNLAALLGNLPLCVVFAAPALPLPGVAAFAILGPLGMYAGIVAAKYAAAAALAPWRLLQLIFGVLGGAVLFGEIPNLHTGIGIVLITICFVLISLTPRQFVPM